MDDSAAALNPNPPLLLPSWKHLRRRNSIATSVVVVPTKLGLSATSTTTKPRHSSSFPAHNGAVAPPSPPQLQLELLSLKTTTSSYSESYTSLKDLIPCSTAVQSPTAGSAGNSGYEISIRNRLVKQAAWAYLQPMSSASGPSGPHFLRRLWLNLSSAPCLSFFRHRLIPFLSQAFLRILRCLGIRVT